MTDFWTMPQITKLRELYPSQTVMQIADELGKEVGQVRSMANRLRLRKLRDWAAIARNHKPIIFRIGG